jgi:hypothetical protein
MRDKKKQLLWLGIGWVLIWLSQPLPADDVQGYLKFFAHPGLTSPYKLNRFGTRLQLSLKKTHQLVDLFASFNFDLDERYSNYQDQATSNRATSFQIYPVEIYLSFHLASVDLRLGKQFIFWGRTDWINPTDNITPWDYTNITAEIEDYRLAVNAIKLNWYFGQSNLEMVFVPYFQPNRTGLDIPEAQTELPEQKPANWQEGLRFSSAISGMNFSFSYWRGFDLFPSVIPEREGLIIKYQPQQVLGVDFDYAWGRFVFKGEGAYYLTKDRQGIDPFSRNPFVYFVLGSDCTLSNPLSLNLQYVEKRVLKWHDGLMSPQERKITRSASARLAYKKEGYYSLQLISVYNFADGDYFLLPIFNYEVADGLNLYAGATFFAGPANSPFGRNKDLSRAFIEIKYSF